MQRAPPRSPNPLARLRVQLRVRRAHTRWATGRNDEDDRGAELEA